MKIYDEVAILSKTKYMAGSSMNLGQGNRKKLANSV